jgi:hypothetical protein
VIRTVALGMVCLAGLGALAAAAKRPPRLEPAEVVFPIVAGSKADRLPLLPHLGKSIGVARVDVAYVPPVEDVAPLEAISAAKGSESTAPHIVSRRWHDPHDRNFLEGTKQGGSKSKLPTKSSANRGPKRAADVKDCRSDGLDPLLRKLNLSPKCE